MAMIHIQSRFKEKAKAGIDEAFQRKSKLKPKMTILLSQEKYKTHILEGDTLHIWTGFGTFRAEKLGEAVCKGVERIEIGKDKIKLNGNVTDMVETDKIARLDGFESVEDFQLHYTRKGRVVFKGLRISWGTTYRRKYFLHREVKKAGFGLLLEETHKTICVPSTLGNEARTNRYIKELQDNYGYGVQFTNPLTANQ